MLAEDGDCGKMRLGLLDNAIDSLLHGLAHYAQGRLDNANYKFAILHFAQAVELLLKARLAKEHWVLIFERVERPDGKTINFDAAVERLHRICHVDLNKYVGDLRNLSEERNRIEHYEVTLGEREAASLIARNVPFLIWFLEAELDTRLQDLVDEEVWLELLQIRHVYEEAKKQAEEKIQKVRWDEREGYDIWLEQCPVCFEEYMVISDDIAGAAKCLFCNHVSVLETCWKCGKRFPDDALEHGLCDACSEYLNKDYT